MGNKFKEFIAAAGLSVVLSATALGQGKQDVDLNKIEADSISITTTDGKVVFNRASSGEAPSGAQNPADIRLRGRREAITAENTGGGRTGRGGGATDSTQQEARARGRTGAATVPATAPATATTTQGTVQERPVYIGSVQDCLNISNVFVENAAKDEARQQKPAATNQGTPPSRTTRTAAPAETGTPSKTYVATCFNDGKAVATITFEPGKKQPEVKMVEGTAPAPGS